MSATKPKTRENQARRAAVLTLAVVRAARALRLSQKALAGVLGVSEASVSRLAQGREIDPQTKEGELALIFLRLFRSLDALLGGDEAKARSWIGAENLHLGGVPSEMIRSVTGLVRTTEYLDAMRGKS